MVLSVPVLSFIVIFVLLPMISELGQIVAGHSGHAVGGIVVVVVDDTGMGSSCQIAGLVILDEILLLGETLVKR